MLFNHSTLDQGGNTNKSTDCFSPTQIKHVQPMLTADEGQEAEALVLGDPVVQRLVTSRYGVTDLSLVICDPWHAFSQELD